MSGLAPRNKLRPTFLDDLRRLRVLREFRERGSVTDTALAMHLTTSAVSQQLSGLSRELGFPVTVKVGRKLVLTPEGKALLDHADAVFARLEEARVDLQNWSPAGRCRIDVGGFSSILTGLLPGVVQLMRVQAPLADLRLHQVESPELFDRLDDGTVDVALSLSFRGSPEPDDSRYHRVELGVDVLDVALPRDHPAADEATVALRDLCGEEWISGTPGGSCDVLLQTACNAAGFTPQIVHRLEDWLSTAAFVAAGQAITLIPRLAQVTLPAGLVIRPLRGPVPERYVFAAIRQGAQNDPYLVELLESLVRSASSLRSAAAAQVGEA
ncbi:LysR family transcriptional regulator [Kribbella sp. CA-293567]|uniref:LysR family transcriptional regulator n=1 Tax=Kribbella sp. CA-293567 TaxID=3002436 RepID=UPI0022DE0C3C|nr:LysR family transcriptional regulator [Kribbella sp. CA-293567]WBQ04357.1 LysR family transcriptional regulator [Kribbella sp. CA-293567]